MLRAMALPDPPPDPTDGGARDRDALVARWRPRLQRLQRAIRERLRISMREQDLEAIARPVRETEGDDADTIFALDVAAEELLDELCNEWAREEAFVLVGEGVEPSGSRTYGEGAPTARLIVDPIDGTRGLMFDKRSAWCPPPPPRSGRARTRPDDLAPAYRTRRDGRACRRRAKTSSTTSSRSAAAGSCGRAGT
jgi:hypothetical protein